MPYANKQDLIKWRQENAERIREYKRAWIAKNPDKQREYGAKFYKENKEKVDEHNKAYAIRYPEKRKFQKRIVEARRRARKYTTDDGTITSNVIIAMFKEQRGKCNLCKARLETYHIDHMIPLAKKGKHTIKNIQLLCVKCNESKGCRLEEEPLKYLEKFL